MYRALYFPPQHFLNQMTLYNSTKKKDLQNEYGILVSRERERREGRVMERRRRGKRKNKIGE